MLVVATSSPPLVSHACRFSVFLSFFLFDVQEEERILRDLLKKISAQAAVHDTENHTAHAAADSKKLDTIVEKYKLSEEDKAALLKWKHD